MTDKELTNAAFELLETNLWDWDEHMNSWCEIHGEDAYCSIFVRDWRVAGALMEKCKCISCYHASDGYSVNAGDPAVCTYISNVQESLPRAIIEACCEALGDSDA